MNHRLPLIVALASIAVLAASAGLDRRETPPERRPCVARVTGSPAGLLPCEPRSANPAPLPLSAMAAPIVPAQGPASHVLRDRNVSLFFTPGGMILSCLESAGRRGAGLRWSVAGARAAEPRPTRETTAKSHVYLGAPSAWKTDQPCHAAMAYDQVLPGVDLEVESRPHGVKYTFHVAAGVDPSAIRVRYEGAEAVEVVDQGRAVEIRTAVGPLREEGLVCWQDTPRGRRAVSARYVPGASGEIGFEVEGRDPLLPLVIDPILLWTRVLSGNFMDSGMAIARDSAGNIYVTGPTSSTNLPMVGAFDTTNGGAGDGYVMKFDPTGTTVLWSTLFGGGLTEGGHGIAIDAAGNIYVVGDTTSTDFPVLNPIQAALNGTSADAFLLKISAAGTLLWSTYLGGTNIEGGRGLALDGSGNVYFVGETWSSNFPLVNAFDSTFANQLEAYIVKIDGSGPTILWSSFLGASGNEFAYGCAVDASGNLVVTGETTSTDFPTTGGFRTVKVGTWDVFVTKVAAAGTGVIWSTYLGGGTLPNMFELATSVALDPAGNVYVTGKTNTNDFPTNGGFDATYGGNEDAFLSKISPNGSTLLWSTYIGGSDEDEGYGVAVDGQGGAYVTGLTRSPDFPLKDPFHPTLGGAFDAFLTKVNVDGTLGWSSYLNGLEPRVGWAITVAGPDDVYVAGNDQGAAFDIFVQHVVSPAVPADLVAGCGLLGADAALLLLLLALRRRKAAPRGR